MSIVKLGDLIHIKHGFAFKGEYITTNDNGIVLVTPGNFKIGGGFKQSDKKFYNGEIPEDYILKANDLIVTMTDLSKETDTLGYAAYVPNDDKIYLHNQRIGLVSIKSNDIDKNYLYWLLRTPWYQRRIANTSNGATVKHTSPERIYKYKFELPDLPKQKRIADVLSTYDELIENNNKRIAILEQMAENLYKEWFVNYRFAGHEKSLFENNIPVGWEKVTLDSILSKIATGLNPRKNFVLGEGDNYYVTIKNMGDNNIYLDEKCDKVTDEAIRKINNRSDLRQGDLLFSGIGTIGRVYLINIPTDNWNISESVFTMRPNEKVSSEYLYLLLLSNDVQNYCQSNANGAAQKGIRMADLKKYAFWLAPQSILDEFTNIVKPIIEQVDLIRKSNVNLIKQRDLLLPRLMSGKLEV